jgi:DnaD/phage-associated family protein
LLGILNKPVADKIGEAIDAYSEEWILAAIEESALANARSWKYVAAILERWGRDGFQVDKRPKGAPNGRGADVGTASLVKDFDWEAADKRREDAERRVAAARAAAVDQVPSARHGAG